jgi:hypothetical protein
MEMEQTEIQNLNMQKELIEMQQLEIQNVKKELLDMENEQKENECSICMYQYDDVEKKAIIFHTTQSGMKHKFCLECLKITIPNDGQLNTAKCPLDNLTLTIEELLF